MKDRLILFTRYPVPGKTKTRLIPALGEKGAADLQRDMTQHMVETVHPLMREGVHIEIRYLGGDRSLMARWLGSDLTYLPQGKGDLGVRMKRAFSESFDSGAEKTLIIGTDCPSITAQDVREALNLLESNPAVLGPAEDGGYYLVALGAGTPDRLYDILFSNIPWGTRDVFSNTVNALWAAGIGLGLLDEKADVDEPVELVHWEQVLRARDSERRTQVKRSGTAKRTGPFVPSTASISVIIPTLNEEQDIGGAIEKLKGAGVEIVVADGGSTDKTEEISRQVGVEFLLSKTGRAAQMNAGSEKASGQILLFLHADTMLPDGWEEMVRGVIATGGTAGAFSFGTDMKNVSMRMIARLANFRARLLGIVFGDQGIFVRADIFHALGGFPDLPIMEDMELVRTLKRRGRFIILPGRALSSSRKWRLNGVWRTTLVNQTVMWLYLFGANPDRLAKWYRAKSKG